MGTVLALGDRMVFDRLAALQNSRAAVPTTVLSIQFFGTTRSQIKMGQHPTLGLTPRRLGGIVANSTLTLGGLCDGEKRG
jgi:hypothetical protein